MLEYGLYEQVINKFYKDYLKKIPEEFKYISNINEAEW